MSPLGANSAAPDSPAGPAITVGYGDELEPVWNDPVLGTVAQGVALQAPLDILLRAAADEAESPAVAVALRRAADDVRRGTPLKSALSNGSLPDEFTEIVQLADEGARAEALLREAVRDLNLRRELRRQIVESLGYLGLLLVATLGIMVALLMVCVPQMKGIFQGFGVELPGATNVVIWWSDVLVNHALVVGLLALAALVGTWLLFANRAVWRSCKNALSEIPGLNSLIMGIAELRFLNVLAVLVENSVPLPRAVADAGAASGLTKVARRASLTAEDLEKGVAPVVAFDNPARWPAMFVIPLEWGRTPEEMSRTMRLVGQTLRLRFRTTTANYVAWAEPLLMMWIAFMFGFVVIAMFMPLVKLLNDLS